MTAPAVGAAARTVGGKVPRGTRAARNRAAKAATPAPTVPAPQPVTNPDNTPPAGGSTKTPKPNNTPPAGTSRSSISLPKVTVPQPASSGAGFVLALLFWSWVALPFLNNGGIQGVRNQLKAKFTNKAPDGSWLP